MENKKVNIATHSISALLKVPGTGIQVAPLGEERIHGDHLSGGTEFEIGNQRGHLAEHLASTNDKDRTHITIDLITNG